MTLNVVTTHCEFLILLLSRIIRFETSRIMFNQATSNEGRKLLMAMPGIGFCKVLLSHVRSELLHPSEKERVRHQLP